MPITSIPCVFPRSFPKGMEFSPSSHPKDLPALKSITRLQKKRRPKNRFKNSFQLCKITRLKKNTKHCWQMIFKRKNRFQIPERCDMQQIFVWVILEVHTDGKNECKKCIRTATIHDAYVHTTACTVHSYLVQSTTKIRRHFCMTPL